MSGLANKIIMGLLGLFLLITVGYQVYTAIYGGVKTETVFEYTVSRSIPVEGFAIRSEVVIDDNFTGIKNCIFEDGTRVSIGENIAEFYENDQSDRNLRRSRELEAEIKMLEEAQDSAINNFSTTEILNRDIKEQLGYLTRLSNSGRFRTVGDVRFSLTSLINRKQIATGKSANYQSRISMLRTEYNGLEKTSNGDSIMFATAPISGYFSENVDGFETKVDPAIAEDYSFYDYLMLIDSEELDAPDKKIGKIVTNQNWLFAATAEKSNLEFVKPGQDVFLTFESINKKISATVKQILQEKDAERAILILSCNQISGDLITLRKTAAVINFYQYTGLRINMSDIRFQDEIRGVYVLDGNTVRFKRIDPIFEDQSFVLSMMIPPEASGEDYVSLFDQIITKGNDLYDGKVTK